MNTAAMVVATINRVVPGTDRMRPTSRATGLPGGARRQNRHAAQFPVDLDRCHHDRGSLDPMFSAVPGAGAGEHGIHGPAEALSHRLPRSIRRDPAVFHDDHQRLDPRVLPRDVFLKIQLGVLGERRADVSSDDRRHIVRRSSREWSTPGDDVTEDRALRHQDRDHEHDEADRDAEIEAAVPAGSTRCDSRDHRLHYHRPRHPESRCHGLFTALP